MAKSSNNITKRVSSGKKKRPGVHSKCKCSKCKGSRNYKKRYRGQGKVR